MLKVLLVDDNSRALEGLLKHLPWEEIDCQCVGTASNGQEALELARKLLPNVVITDVRMPVMDGIDLCRQLHTELPGTLLVVESAYDDFDYAKQLILCGVKNYILKPMDDAKIRELADMLLQFGTAQAQDAKSVSALLGSEWESRLYESLKTGNTEALSSTLQELFEGDRSFRATMDLASDLLHLLYSLIRRLGLPDTCVSQPLGDAVYALQSSVSKDLAASYVIKQYANLCESIVNNKSADAGEISTVVRMYVDKMYADPELSTSTLAAKFKISQSYLCHIFKNNQMCNINSYITGVRTEKAHALLLNTDLSVLEISAKVGYSDPHYFAKVYKKAKGMSPSEMRKLAIERY